MSPERIPATDELTALRNEQLPRGMRRNPRLRRYARMSPEARQWAKLPALRVLVLQPCRISDLTYSEQAVVNRLSESSRANRLKGILSRLRPLRRQALFSRYRSGVLHPRSWKQRGQVMKHRHFGRQSAANDQSTRQGGRRSAARIPVVMLGTVAAALALVIPASAGSAQLPLNLTKTCDPAGTPCVVTQSNVAALPPGTTEDYLGPEYGYPVLSSGVVITTSYQGGGTATGHCTWPLRSASGTCVFSQGTGSLAGFHAKLTVTANGDFSEFFWNGTYQL